MIINKRYIKEKPIGKGAYGDVWRARDLKIHKRVALKVVSHYPNCLLLII
jgi:serine/threonine protein kinase